LFKKISGDYSKRGRQKHKAWVSLIILKNQDVSKWGLSWTYNIDKLIFSRQDVVTNLFGEGCSSQVNGG
jgi:hypothetical protein